MIKRVLIKGFQSHVDTNIEFHSHLNVIVGPSNAGKSAILRALKKVIRDLPAGNDFINQNTDTCEITVENDFQIKRKVVRGAKDNTKINEYCVNKQSFSSFGREIPQEVVDALNMPIINFDDKLELDLHFANQHAGPFLLDETASVKSKVLGRISGLNVIDGAIQTVKTETRQDTNTLKIVNTDIEQLTEKLQAFPDISTLENQVTTFTKKLGDLELSHIQLTRLRMLASQLTDIVSLGNTLHNELDSLPDLDNLNFDGVRIKMSEHMQLKKLLENLDVVTNQVSTLETDPILEITITSGNFESVKDKIAQQSKLAQFDVDFDQKTVRIKQISAELEELEGVSGQTKQKWERLLKELGICPTCKQSTKEVKFN